MYKIGARTAIIISSVFLVLLFLTVPMAEAEVRPGQSNPVMNPNRWTLFRDDEVVLFIENLDKDSQNLLSYSMSPTSADLTSWDTEQFTGNIDHKIYPYDNDHFDIATGRVTNIEKDQIVRVYLDSDNFVVLEVLDNHHNVVWEKAWWDDSKTSIVRVAVGDMDRKYDDDGNFHDEIAVATLTPNASIGSTSGTKIKIEILNYRMTTIGHEDSGYDYENQEDMTIHLEMGDFDGDDLLELAVIRTGHESEKFSVRGYYYENDDLYSVREEATCDSYGYDVVMPVSDSAVGDFNGDGRDDLAFFDGISLHLLQADENMQFSVVKVEANVAPSSSGGRMVSGLFYMDPDNGYGINRRQLAIATSSSRDKGENTQSFLYVNWYLIEDNFDIITKDFIGIHGDEDDHSFNGFDLAAGNFIGHQNDNTSPIMQLAFSYIEYSPVQKNGAMIIEPAKEEAKVNILKIIDNKNLEIIHTITDTLYETNSLHDRPKFITSVAALDLDGNTYRLGAPSRLTVENFIAMTAILQEPPKHVDYLPAEVGEWEGDWKVINVSAYPDHYVAFESTSETEMDSETTCTTDHVYGGSLAVSGSSSWEVGIMFMSGAVTVADKFKTRYDYETHKKEYESEYHKESISISSETSGDDILYGSYQTIDIWRYRILGKKTENGKNLYQDIVMPGSRRVFVGGG
ncbi:MAG: hypothetical protein JRJ14_07615, partial [Deltaproteobacteria bacterium]|nr:hypothetical protein [Deltaproteobacteria bacterium]